MVKESSSIMGELLYQIDKRVPRVDNADDKTIAGAASLGWKGRLLIIANLLDANRRDWSPMPMEESVEDVADEAGPDENLDKG